MKKVLIFFISIGLMLLIVMGCSKAAFSGDEITAEEFVKSQGYKINARKGEVQKYTLEKNKLIGGMNIPYQQSWGVQKIEPDKYFGKEITVYGFTVSNHPLKKIYKINTIVFIMLAEGKVIGGYAFPDAEMVGAYYSLDGKTLEELTGLSFKDWSENWSKKYANEVEDNIDLKYGNTIALNGTVYGFTGENVSAEKIDKQIGEGQRVVSPKVEQNGDIGCPHSECNAPQGRVFYSIQEIPQEEAIAVQINDGQYLKCVKLRKL
jgi:hypothetical protein